MNLQVITEEFLYNLFHGFYNDFIIKMIFTLIGIAIFIGTIYFVLKVIISILEFIDDEIGFYNIFNFLIKTFLVSVGVITILFIYSLWTEYDQKNNDKSIEFIETKETMISKVKRYYPHAKVTDLNLIYEEVKYFDLDFGLVYAIVATESSFKRNQKSKSNAYGLFQLKIGAAKDATIYYESYPRVDAKMLQYNPINNIELGVAYINLLWSKYLQHIEDENKRTLILVYSYNGGIGRILRVFHQNKLKAQQLINGLTIDNIKSKLNKNLLKRGYRETVNYQKKVYERMYLFTHYTTLELFLSKYEKD